MLEDCGNAVLPDLYWSVYPYFMVYFGNQLYLAVVFSSGYNLNGVKQKICVVCDSLCHTFAEVNLKGLFSVFYFYKRMADLCYKDTL